MKKEWILAKELGPKHEKIDLDLNSVIIKILWQRGFRTKEAIDDFIKFRINPKLSIDLDGSANFLFYDPFLFKDMGLAVEMIIKHLRLANKIVIYGDYDADGITSASILYQALKFMKANVGVYLPDRISEGYGMNKEVIKKLSLDNTALIITVDNGIRSKKEIDYAKSLGIDVIVSDHHVLPEEKSDIPECPIINPANKEDKYPWPFLAGAGVAFKLVSALIIKSTLNKKQKRYIINKTLPLVAIGTVADMVSLLGENRVLLKKGLELLNRRDNLGLEALFKVSKVRADKEIEAWNIGWQIGPRLNAASRLKHANTAFNLINAKDKEEAKILAEELNKRNLERQKITEDIISQVEKALDKNNLPNIIISAAPAGVYWNEGVIGVVAGKIIDQYHRPALIFSRTKDEESGEYIFKASGRSIEGFNLVSEISKLSKYLHKYGGHPQACGLTIIGEENLNKFSKELLEVGAKKIDDKILVPKLKIDLELDLDQLNLDLAKELEVLAPYGQNNLQPIFLSKKLKLKDMLFLGEEKQHLKLYFSGKEDSNINLNVISFNASDSLKQASIGTILDLVYYLEVNNFNQSPELQLKLIDWRFSK